MKNAIYVSKGPFSDIPTAARAEAHVDWWDDGQVSAQTACTLAFAATELASFLPDAEIYAAEDNASFHADTVILLGGASINTCTAALEQTVGHSLSAVPAKDAEAFRICGLIHDGIRYVVLSGSDRTGTLYAAYAYLERLGYRFIEPGMVSVDQTAILSDDVFDITEAPQYTSRGTMSSFIDPSEEFLLWMARNRFNSGFFRKAHHNFHLRKKLGIRSVVGGHQMYYLFADTTQEYPYKHAIYGGDGKPDDPYAVSPLCHAPSSENGVLTYGDAHPEWYALVNGERRMRRFREQFLRAGNAPGDNMCTSNEDAMTELVRLIIDALIDGEWKHADDVHIWPLDNGIWCECDACKEQGNYTARILMIAYRVDKAIKKAYADGRIKRKITLIIPAYHETLPVPDKPLPADFDYTTIQTVFYPIERCYLHNLDDPICTETNKLLLDRLLPWSSNPHYQGELVIGEYYNVSSFAAMPFVLTSRILHEIPMYYRIGVRHFHYMHITARDWGFIAINNYLYGKLIWNPDADGEAIVASYFASRYGTAAAQMRTLYERMEKVTANCKFYKHYQFVDGKIRSLFAELRKELPLTAESLFPAKHMKLDTRADDPQAGPSLQETLEGLEACYETMKSILADFGHSDALIRDERRLSYGVTMTRFLYLICRVSIDPTDTVSLAALQKLAAILEADTDCVKGYDFDDLFLNGLTATWIPGTYRERFAPENASASGDGVIL